MARRPESVSDVKVLLDFLNPAGAPSADAQITSLQTLSMMCSEEVAELMYQYGGLNIIWKLCGKTRSHGVSQACLYTLACAVEKSVKIKLIMTTTGVFNTLKSILTAERLHLKTRLCAIYLLMPLVCWNECGQELARTCGCLDTLLKNFITAVYTLTSEKVTPDNLQTELWTLSAMAIRRAIAFPRNSRNQLECVKYIPHMVSILHESKSTDKAVLHACQVLGAVMEKNETCQERAFTSRALEVLLLLLRSCFDSSQGEGLLGEIILALHSLLEDRKEYCDRFQKLGGITLMLEFLEAAGYSKLRLTVHHTNHILIILSRCAGYSGCSRQTLIKSDAASTIVRLMNSIEGNDHFNRICAFILSQCMQEPQGGNESESEDVTASDQSHESDDETSSKHPLGDEEIYNTALDGSSSHVHHVIERQQKQIDLIQELLLQERKKRVENEKTLIEISKQTPRSTSGGSILSPGPSECPSCRTPLFTVPRTNTCLETPRNSQSQVFRLAAAYRLPDTPSHTDGTAISQEAKLTVMEQTKDNGFLHSREDNSENIDVESCTPETDKKEPKVLTNSNKNVNALKQCKLLKYYVTEESRIKQHVATAVTPIRSSEQRSSTPCPQLCKKVTKNDDLHFQSRKSTFVRPVSRTPCHNPKRAAGNCVSDEFITQCRKIIFSRRRGNMKNAPMKELRSHITKSKSMSNISRGYDDNDPCALRDHSPPYEELKKPRVSAAEKKTVGKSEQVKFTAEEERNIIRGVRECGKNFNEIIYTYNFHPTRTALDLRAKYRKMCEN